MGGRALVVRPLTAEAFAPYGDVITSEGREGRLVNAGTSVRIEMPAPDVLAHGGTPSLSVFRANATRLPIEVRALERHRIGSQTFLPLGGVSFVAVVALGDSAPDLQTLAAFLSNGMGITLRRDVWHHPLLSLDDGDFAVVERHGSQPDCEIAELPYVDRVQLRFA